MATPRPPSVTGPGCAACEWRGWVLYIAHDDADSTNPTGPAVRATRNVPRGTTVTATCPDCQYTNDQTGDHQ